METPQSITPSSLTLGRNSYHSTRHDPTSSMQTRLACVCSVSFSPCPPMSHLLEQIGCFTPLILWLRFTPRLLNPTPSLAWMTALGWSSTASLWRKLDSPLRAARSHL